jgi:hypothetical protein
MLRYEIEVRSPADRVLYDGLPRLQPVLSKLGRAAVLIGGLASAAWLDARPVGLPVRATRDVDLGIDQLAIGVSGRRAIVRPLLVEQDFVPGFGDEPFRFSYDTGPGLFIVDLLVAKGSSRAEPPIVEAGLESLAAPGLRYAIDRGPVPLQLVLVGQEEREFDFFTVQLDAAFVMKATLAASGARMQVDKRVVDTADAVMLAAACAEDPAAMRQLATSRRLSEPRRAIRWIGENFTGPRSAAARRMANHVGDESGGEWAVDVAGRFAAALAAAVAP